MNASWQDLAALSLVVLALVYLARSLAGSARGTTGGCGGGGCSRCPSNKQGAAVGDAQEPLDLITLESIGGSLKGRGRETEK